MKAAGRPTPVELQRRRHALFGSLLGLTAERSACRNVACVRRASLAAEVWFVASQRWHTTGPISSIWAPAEVDRQRDRKTKRCTRAPTDLQEWEREHPPRRLASGGRLPHHREGRGACWRGTSISPPRRAIEFELSWTSRQPDFVFAMGARTPRLRTGLSAWRSGTMSWCCCGKPRLEG